MKIELLKKRDVDRSELKQGFEKAGEKLFNIGLAATIIFLFGLCLCLPDIRNDILPYNTKTIILTYAPMGVCLTFLMLGLICIFIENLIK